MSDFETEIFADRDRRTVAVFDLDRTLTRYGTFSPFLLWYAARRPLLWPGFIPALFVGLAVLVGAIGREAAKIKLLKLFFEGADRETVRRAGAAFVARLMRRGLRPGAQRFLSRHRAAGHFCVLATASMDFVAEALGAALQFDLVVSSRSKPGPNRTLSGDILGRNCYGEAKLDLVKAALPMAREACFVVAYSDHASDAPLFDWADRAVAVNPKSAFEKEAQARGWPVVDWEESQAPARGISAERRSFVQSKESYVQ